MKWFVAPSYENYEKVGDVFTNDKGNKVIRIKQPCPKCGGLGIIVARVENGQPIPIPVDGGICYRCGGSKVEEKVVRAYTEKEYNALIRAKERREERKKAADAARKQDLIDNATTYKHTAALKFGFGEDEKIYIVYGGNTYNIKDQLKEMGAKFDPIFKWYFSKMVDNLPEGYHTCAFSFDEICNYNIYTKYITIKIDAETIIKNKLAQFKETPNYVYYPSTVGDRLRNLPVKLAEVRGFDGYYGHTYIYKFTYNNYLFVWMTSKCLDFEVGDEVELTGTIKKFDTYNDEEQTHLSRCIVKEMED